MASILRVNTLTDASSNNSTAMSTINQGTLKAWVNFGGSTPTAIDSFNISSLDDDGTGDYGVNINNDMANAGYAITLSCDDQNDGGSVLGIDLTVGTIATGAFDIETFYLNSSTNRTNYDKTNAMCQISGDLA
tara:strand:- start:224 stop:622 length:399 start_codon:yes stop_codon:yes gene_type:complete